MITSVRRVMALVVAMTLSTLGYSAAPVAAGELHSAVARGNSRTVVLYNSETDRCADVPNFGAAQAGEAVTQYFCRPGEDDNQRMDLVQVGQYGRFLIRVHANGQNPNSSLCFDLPNFKTVDKGTRLSLFGCRPHNDNQLFYKRKIAQGYQLIHNRSGLCLDVAGYKSKKPGEALMLWPCSEDDDHTWQLMSPESAPIQDIPVSMQPPKAGPGMPNDFQYQIIQAIGDADLARDSAGDSPSPSDVARWVLSDMDDHFPFPGCGGNVWVGKVCSIKAFPLQMPVRFERIWENGFALSSLPGHPEGAGRLIEFAFVYGPIRGGGTNILLTVRSTGPATGCLMKKTCGRGFNIAAYHLVWNSWAISIGPEFCLTILCRYLREVQT